MAMITGISGGVSFGTRPCVPFEKGVCVLRPYDIYKKLFNSFLVGVKKLFTTGVLGRWVTLVVRVMAKR